jgi:hypothetical protein
VTSGKEKQPDQWMRAAFDPHGQKSGFEHAVDYAVISRELIHE